ncbi:MAG: hypothetical protein IPM36_09485 [Lewinellaceae bacterium]|nr:hypothetical protein [Lewinellaceae bacterium]
MNSKEVAAYIESEFGVRYSLSAVVKLLPPWFCVKAKGVGVKADRKRSNLYKIE